MTRTAARVFVTTSAFLEPVLQRESGATGRRIVIGPAWVGWPADWPEQGATHVRAHRPDHRGLPPRGPHVPAAGGLQGAQRSSPAPFLYDEADEDYEGFWARQAAELARLVRGLGHDPRLGAAVRQVVRRRQAQRRRTTASTATSRPAGATRSRYHWEGEPGDTRTITYADLLAEVQRFANVLKDLGVQKGDRVAIYMPMIPELPVAHARLRPHRRRRTRSSSAASAPTRSSDRINDAEGKVLVTADGGFRRGAAGAAQAERRRRAGRHAVDRARRRRATRVDERRRR